MVRFERNSKILLEDTLIFIFAQNHEAFGSLSLSEKVVFWSCLEEIFAKKIRSLCLEPTEVKNKEISHLLTKSAKIINFKRLV